MTERRVKSLLLGAIAVMTVLPLLAAFYFLDLALQTSLNLGFSPQVARSLEVAAQNLRTLRDLDPAHQQQYRQDFEQIEALRQVYEQPELVKRSLLDSLKIYFGLGLVAAVLLAVFVALLVSRRIARSYTQTFEELLAHRERVRYLEQMSSWQELARMLAHEIKNPLTPIEVLVTSLSRAYLGKTQAEFAAQLSQTEAMIGEELQHLKRTVAKFSEFARLPHVQLEEHAPTHLLAQQVRAIATTFEGTDIELNTDACPADSRVRFDATLFRQALTNIVANGVEANHGRRVRFEIRLACDTGQLCIAISNDGEPVPAEIAGRIFDPYVSGKGGKDNMGLGLAIVKKIIIEHGGEIAYTPLPCGQPCFTILLPRVR